MPDLWFFIGLAMGIALGGFASVGSYARGADSVRNAAWRRDLPLRQLVARASRGSRHADAA
ncbi:MAG TPA: hypothetical protein VFV20_06420 [Candidatus Limnocylindria bacterium]|nr:hypothetical protein [Candidatus Limnocylindria bacterium]